MERVVVDVSQAHFWALTAVAALDNIILRFREAGVSVKVLGLNAPSATLVERFGLHDKPEAKEHLI